MSHVEGVFRTRAGIPMNRFRQEGIASDQAMPCEAGTGPFHGGST